MPYKKTGRYPEPGRASIETDDIRGGMGFEGLTELAKFVAGGRRADHRGLDRVADGRVRAGGGVTVEHPAQLFARGSILRGVFTDLKSPIAYGYDGKDLPVYFNQDPVLNAPPAAGFGGFGGGAAAAAVRRGPERDAERRADPHFAARAGGSAGRRARGPAGAAAGVAAAGVAAGRRRRRSGRLRGRHGAASRGAPVPIERERHAALRHAGRRRSAFGTRCGAWTCRSARATS